MQILLKDLLNENDSDGPLSVQIYCDMDGVLVDMDAGFKKISGGYTVENFKTNPIFNGDIRIARKEFWKLIKNTPDFWINLPEKPDAKVLWEFIKENFKNPLPVVLSAGEGASLISQKTEWIRRHIDPSVKVIISKTGVQKSEYILNSVGRVSHVLIDDTQRNIDAWDRPELHRIAIVHKNAANTIEQLKVFLNT